MFSHNNNNNNNNNNNSDCVKNVFHSRRPDYKGCHSLQAVFLAISLEPCDWTTLAPNKWALTIKRRTQQLRRRPVEDRGTVEQKTPLNMRKNCPLK
jgi:hypothetical protein